MLDACAAGGSAGAEANIGFIEINMLERD